MIFGDLAGLNLPDTCLTGEEKPLENLTQETCTDWGSNPGPLPYRRACYRLLHSAAFHNGFYYFVVGVKNINSNKISVFI